MLVEKHNNELFIVKEIYNEREKMLSMRTDKTNRVFL
jgi:hypothetical protein